VKENGTGGQRVEFFMSIIFWVARSRKQGQERESECVGEVVGDLNMS